MKCPYCDYVTPEPDDGDEHVRAWQEVSHMQTVHPEIVDQRLREAGLLDADVRFGTTD
jgi:hypothetical protein